MHETIIARHLAPVAFVPRGGRTVRMGMFRVETPVRVAHVGPGAVEPSRRPSDPYGTTRYPGFSHEGREYLRIGTRDSIARVLAGDLEGAPFPLRGTPWSPFGNQVESCEGEPEEVSRRIAWDGRADAAAEAVRLSGTELLFHEGAAYRHSPGGTYGFCSLIGDGKRTPEAPWPSYTLAQDPNAYVAAAQRLRPLMQAWVAGTGRRTGNQDASWGSALEGRTGRDEDLRAMACALLQRTHESMDKALRRTEVARDRREGLREAWERLMPWRLRAEVGMVPESEAGPAFAAAEAGLDALAAARGGEFGTKVQRAYVRTLAYPALAAVGADAGSDAGFLDALAPGR
jgi:hypothetical protein